jgi:hypothetical protein
MAQGMHLCNLARQPRRCKDPRRQQPKRPVTLTPCHHMPMHLKPNVLVTAENLLCKWLLMLSHHRHLNFPGRIKAKRRPLPLWLQLLHLCGPLASLQLELQQTFCSHQDISMQTNSQQPRPQRWGLVHSPVPMQSVMIGKH